MASVYEGDSQDLRIVLLGVCGAGKSPTANAIMGREAFKESRTRESEKQTGRLEGRNISIIDTPGFFNTQLTDEEMKKQMIKCLYLSDPGPHVFLLVINLKTFREEQRNIMEQIQENFGEEALKFTMVLFIGREKISRRECIEITESEETQKLLNYFESRFHVINSKNECDLYQITKLLKSIDEMVKNNGGQNYSNEIYLENQRKLREHKERRKQEADLRIVLLGKNGAGKTATANTILGRNEFKMSWTRACEKKQAVVSGRTISIIDTPGSLDSHFQDELKNDIEKCIDMSPPGPHVFLLVIKLHESVTEEEKNTVKWIQDNFGEDAVRHTFALFTHVDLLKEESLDLYIRKSPDLQSLIDSCDGRFHSFNNQDRNDQNQVTELLEKIDKLMKTNREEHYANEECLVAINIFGEQRETQKDTRQSFPVSTSPEENREQRKGINQEDKINTQTNKKK